jgi:hypothetical protein
MLFSVLIAVTDDNPLNNSIDPNLTESWTAAIAREIEATESDSDDDLQKLLNTTVEDLPSQKRSSSPNTRDSTPANKSRRISVHQSSAKLAKEGMQELGECMKAAMVRAPELPTITRFDQSLPILSQMRETGALNGSDYLKYCRLLRSDEKLAAMFVGMDEDLRLEWLESEIEFAAAL